VLAATGLLLAAAITQHQAAERRLGAAHAVGEVLAHAPDLEHAAPAILRGVCGGLGWQFGALGLADDDKRLQCFAAWSERGAFTAFVESSHPRTFEAGADLPGRVWASRAAVWIEDVVQRRDFPRHPAAAAAGLHGGFGFPICLGNDVLGVIEFFADRVVAPDVDLLAAMSTIGNQVGQFIGRKRVEDSIRDAAQRKDEFLAVLAHELRNPLAPIRTGLELVRRAGDDPRAVAQVRTMMERQVTHMVRLIDDLLDVSRITSGKIHLQRQHAALSEMVEAAVEANRHVIQSMGVHLDIDLPASPPRLWVDPTRLVQVISNLLQNAAKFSHPGGRVSIHARVIATAGSAAELTVTVSDEGRGIAAELLPCVFELFTQGDRPEGGATGLGIGLALARRIVEMHGGRIEARSDGPGKGAEFQVSIPAAVSRMPEVTETPLADKTAVPINPRVLVVDDNEDAADVLARLVRAMGGTALTAHDGISGLHAAVQFAPDTILLDIGMPGLDGYETCRRMRETLGPAVMIVALTGWGQERDKARALAAGFDAHLTKPAEPDALERLLAARTPGIA
jgi:signal transduction histidine kinase/ActR/RegA family two-component response regulator